MWFVFQTKHIQSFVSAQVPDKVKQEMLAKIKSFLASYAAQPQPEK